MKYIIVILTIVAMVSIISGCEKEKTVKDVIGETQVAISG